MKKRQLLLGITCICFSTGFFAQDNELKFSYDNAGNETSYYLPTAKSAEEILEDVAALDEELSEKQLLDNKFSVSPNPTRGQVTLQWKPELQENITSIQLVSLINSETRPVSFDSSNSVSVDLNNKAAGLYLVIFHLKNEKVSTIQKKIIKY